MASGERRLGSGRRGMTVLGKIPTPSVPKPINLPSQRLENRGLEPNVALVPRGTFSWGSAGRSNAVALSKEGGSNIGSSPPTSSVAWNGTLKMQALSAASNDAGSLDDSRPLSAGSTRPSSAPTAATASVWGSGTKTKVEMQVSTNVFTVNPVEPGFQESADLTPQQKNVLSNRPTTADGTVFDRHTNSHPGVDAHASARSHPGSGSEGFQHPGDEYNSQRNHHHVVWQGMPPAGGRELPVVPGPYTGPLPHEVYYSPYGVPQYGNVKDRDMVVFRMVNGPGVYGNFPPHLRPAECFGPPGSYGNYQSAARQVEQFAMSGNSAMGTSSCPPGMSFGFFPDGNKYSFQEGDGQFGAVPGDAGYPSLQRDMDSIHISSFPTHGTEWKHRMPRPFEKHNHASGELGTYAKDGVATCAMPAPEKKITLLTKMPKVEAPSTETIINNSTLLLDSSQGDEGGQQKTVRSIVEVENVNTVSEVKDVKNTDESLESNKLDRGVAKMNIRDTKSEVKPDVVAVICSKDTVSEVDSGVSKTFSSRSPKTWRKAAGRSEVNGLSSAQKSLPSTNTQDSGWKTQTSHHFKSDNDSRGQKLSKQGHEGTHSSATSESAGTGSEAVLTAEITRSGIEENIFSKDDQKTKTKALNHKSEKEWRPKSPVVESRFSGHRVAKGGKRNERVCIADSAKEVLSQDCSTGSIVLEASSPSQTQKAARRRAFKNQESLSSSASSDINFDKEAPLHLIEDPNSSQSQVVEVTVDPSEYQRTFVSEASYSGSHNTARSDDNVLHADTSKVMITEGPTLKGNLKVKTRQLNHKGEKEWRPKSPAVDNTATADNVTGNQASEANVTLTTDIDIKIIHELNSSEQEGLQSLDAYDYEGQRAKLKEIAAQRAKQRRKEEEERIKEQRAKALAKLDELNRRTLANPSSTEVVEHGSLACMDEAPNKKTKRKFNPSRRSSIDVPASDAGALEKQHIDEVDKAPVKDSMSISTTTPLHKKYPGKVGTDTKELPSSDVIFPQNARSNRDELADRNNSKTAEKWQLHKFQTATRSYQEQRQQSAKEKLIAEEDLLSAVHDTEVEPFSSKKFGVEIRKDDSRPHKGWRQTDLTQDQTDKAPLMHRNERRGAVEEHQELEPSKLVVSQIGDSQDKGGFPGRRRSQEISIEGENQTKAGELHYAEEHSFALGSGEMKTFTNAGGRKQSAGNSRLGQKYRSEIETCLAIEEAQSLGFKRPMESTVSSDAIFVSEKLSKPHVSWRQKNPNHVPNSDKPLNGLNKDMGSALEESQSTPSQVRKSHKFKNAGGKEHAASGHQGGHIQPEVVEEKGSSISGSAISEITALNADLPKHEVEAKGSENVKIGRSHNSRRQKNITNGSYMVKQTSMKEFNERHPESWAATEAFEEMVDPTHFCAASTSNLRHPSAHTKQSLRAGLGAPPWHKHRSMKLSNANLSLGQAGSLVPGEEHSPGQGGSVSRNRSRSNMANTQGWETEHSQEAESLPVSSHTGKGGAQFQAELTLSLEASARSAQNQKHQQVYSAKGTEIFPDQHLNVSSSKNRSNHMHAENRKMSRHYQAGPQAFRPREQHHDTEFESGNNRGEQRGTSRGRDKPARKSQFNGCSTVAELDRRGADPAIKTEISY